jgi:hypothetical protein
MIIARKGDPVLCSRGHVNGHIEKDIADTDVIKPDDGFFGIDDAVHKMTPAIDGHVCSQCGERITRLHKGNKGAYEIRTAHGWIGQL